MKKITFTVVTVLLLLFLFALRVWLQPDFETTMGRDTYDFDWIFCWYPLFALIWGGALAFVSGRDWIFSVLSLGIFCLCFFAFACVTSAVIPLYSLLITAIALLSTCIVGWIWQWLA